MTTDTAAALRGVELGVDVLMKATKVDGIYDSDPEKNPYAERYEKLTYHKAIQDGLKVMDVSALDLCQRAKLPILVFNFKHEKSIEKAMAGHPIGTLVSSD